MSAPTDNLQRVMCLSRTQSAPVISISAPPAPKKRKRRAPASGAADDCFTCRKEGTKCDRKRPYCQQCLDRGQTCSGYKTQLTWGVGVASRGKLRGLALPIAGSAALPTKASDRRQRRKTMSVDETRLEQNLLAPPKKLSRSSSFAGSTVSEFSFDDLSSPMTAPLMPVPEMEWPVFDNDFALPPAPTKSLLTESLLQLQTSQVWDDLAIPSSATTNFTTWSDSDLASTVDFPATPEDVSFLSSSLPHMCAHSPISPAFSHMSPSFYSIPHTPTFMEAPTSFPRMHQRSISTMSCPTYWEPVFKPVPEYEDVSSLGIYPEWNALSMMM